MFLTRIGGADLSASTGLSTEQLQVSCGTPETKLPAGLTAPTTWPCPPDDDD